MRAIPSIAAAQRGHRATERRECVFHCRLCSGRCRRAGRGDRVTLCACLLSINILSSAPPGISSSVLHPCNICRSLHRPACAVVAPFVSSGFLRRTGNLEARKNASLFYFRSHYIVREKKTSTSKIIPHEHVALAQRRRAYPFTFSASSIRKMYRNVKSCKT
jgi:hypothetical protein